MTTIIDNLLAALPAGRVHDVRIGAFWTTVVVDVCGERRCGLASVLREDDHHRGGGPAVPGAGELATWTTDKLAKLATSDSLFEAGIGIATINALLPRFEARWVDLNAETVIARYGAGKNVALVGHFPFVPRLREHVGTLWVLEQNPGGKDLHADVADEIIPQADVLAITGTTLINGTFEQLMDLRRPDALVLVLGPSTPLSPALFDIGVDLLSGSIVENIDAVVRAASQGANFRQLHACGMRLVTMHTDTVTRKE